MDRWEVLPNLRRNILFFAITVSDYSHSMAQSIKLSYFETATLKTIEDTKNIPSNLAETWSNSWNVWNASRWAKT